jgi:ribonuclease G
MTRQNVTDGPREVMTKKCPTCGGDGIVVSEHTAAVDVERRLRGLVTPGSRAKAFRVEVAAKVAWLVAGPGGSRLRELEETTKRRFFLVGKEGEHLDHFKVLEQGTLEKVAPALPVEVGQELDLKLVEVGLHDPHAGVGKLDDVDVVVGDAAKLVGKKVKARVAALGGGIAWAELLSPVEAPDEPLTAEAEAERPTRAKRTQVARKVEEEEEAEEEAVAEPAVDEPEVEAETEGENDGEEPTPAKKRTRRGSRGGRGRKKKTAAVAAEGPPSDAPADDESPETPEADEPPEAEEVSAGPVIHVPDRELSDDGEPEAPAKKRTRRGSRGGRNRRKKTAAAAGATATVEAEAPAAETAPDGGAPARDGDDWGYTPMSEWGLDDADSA